MEIKFPAETKKRMDFYQDNYHLAFIHFRFQKKMYLGNSKNKICRFCGKNEEKTTFRKAAHAIPEFIGNKYLLSNYECDNCNEFFSISVEDHFAKYTNLQRTISQVPGKKGVPAAKSLSGLSRIDIDENGIKIQSRIDDDFTEIDEEKKIFIIKGYRQPYIPRYVYKCLVKMALSLMPFEQIDYFKDTIKWLMIKDVSNDNFSTESLKCIRSFTPGPHPFKWVTAILLKRKHDKLITPHMSFFIAFANYTFQIFLPLSDKDYHLHGKTVTIPAFPNMYEDVSTTHDVTWNVLNLSSEELVKEQMSSMTMHFDEMILKHNQANSADAKSPAAEP